MVHTLDCLESDPGLDIKQPEFKANKINLIWPERNAHY